VIRKSSHLLGLLVLLLVAANLGADFLFLLILAIVPLIFEQLHNKISFFHVTSQGLQKLPRPFRAIILSHYNKAKLEELEEEERDRLKTIAQAFFFVCSFFLFLYSSGICNNIYQGVTAFALSSYSSFVLYLLLYILLFTAIKYDKRLLIQENAADDEIKRQNGRLKYLGFNIYFNLTLVLLSMIDIAIGAEQAKAFSLDQLKNFLTFVVVIFPVALNIEAFFKLLLAFARFLYSKKSEPVKYNLVLLEAFFGKETFKQSIAVFFEDLLGLDLKKSELFKFFISIFEPVFIFSLILVWLLTAFVIIGPDQAGIIYRLGQPREDDCSNPGLVLKLPWPLGNYVLEKKNQVRLINIGFEPDADANHIIWTKPHSKENFNLVVGDGLEILSIDCQIMYKLKNVKNYLHAYQNPEELVTALAYRFLTFATVSSSFDAIMNHDRRLLAERFSDEMQAELDRRNCGIEIVKVVFLAMHPPIEVADAFEDVVSAQLDRLTFSMIAETESMHTRFMHEAFAVSEIYSAKGDASTMLAEATGQSLAFISQSLGYNYSPELARFRLKLSSLQKLVESKKLYVIDKSFLRPTDKILLRVTE